MLAMPVATTKRLVARSNREALVRASLPRTSPNHRYDHEAPGRVRCNAGLGSEPGVAAVNRCESGFAEGDPDVIGDSQRPSAACSCPFTFWMTCSNLGISRCRS